MAWPCFLIEPTLRYQRYTRRYSKDCATTPACPYGSYHNASEIIDVVTVESHEDVITYTDGTIPEEIRKTAKFPSQCLCGYYFVAEDHWQYGFHLILRDERTGNEYTKLHAPVGAMWHAPWMLPFPEYNHAGDPKGPIVVRLPGGHDWIVDGPARNGGYWSRQGTPPNLTVTPSIQAPGYHGFLRDGVLTDPC